MEKGQAMIGVIGGNGVAATNKLCQIIENKCTKNGAFRDCHHPEMLVWQATQAPSRSMYLEGRGESFLADYIRIGKHLKAGGCQTLCMCCNTAHYFIHELEDGIGIRFINILEEVAKQIKLNGGGKIGIMCSDGLRKVGLYETEIHHFSPKAEIIYPTANLQVLVTKGICNAKNNKRYLPADNEEHPHYCFSTVCDWFAAQGCDTIVAGCTDIRNVFYREPTPYQNYIDSLEVLANTIIKYSLEK